MNQIFSGTTIVLSSFLLFSCSNNEKAKAPATGPIPVSLQDVTLQNAVYYDEYPATVVALSQVDLRAEVGGYITGIFFKEGEHVHKGQKLYEIDRSKYQAAYNVAAANVQQAKTNQDKAQKDADRYIYLNKQDAIAKQILDHAMSDLENAKSAVASAQAALYSAKTDLNFSEIAAPFDGTIGLSQVKLGTLVSANQTLLNTISTDGPTAIDFVVNEKDVIRFSKIQNAHLGSGDSTFTLLLPDKSLYNATGYISVIDRAVDPQTGTLKVRLNFPNAQSILKTGMSCTVRVRGQDRAEQMLIPNKAVTEQMGEYFVFIAKDTVLPVTPPDATAKKGDDKKEETKKESAGPTQPAKVAVLKKVILGAAIGGNVIVKSGIQPGEKIVVDGLQKLRDGAQINPDGIKPAATGGKM